MEASWTRSPYSDLHLWPFDDEYVLFDSGSGSVHELDPIAAHVIEQIAAGPRTLAELKDSILRAYDFLADTDLDNYLDSLLRTLFQKHIIRPIDA